MKLPRIGAFVLLLLSLTGGLRAQSLADDILDSRMFDHTPDDFLRIGLTSNNYFLEDGAFQSYGIRIELSIDPHWTAMWNCRFLVANSIRATHMPVGMRVAGLIAEGTSQSHTDGNEGIVYLFMLSAAIPEGVGYKISPDAKIQVMPYLSPLGMDREVHIGSSPEAPGQLRMSGSAGLELQSNMQSTLYAGLDLHTTLIYKGGRLEPTVGFILGMRVRS